MIRKSSFISCIIFFIAHVCYLIFFLIIQLDLLIYVNIFSVCLYALCLLLLKYRYYTVYAIIAAIEIAIFMAFGSIVLGPAAGFHFCLIGLTVLVFFAGYFSKAARNRIKPVYFSLFYMALFAFQYYWSLTHEPLRQVHEAVNIVLYVVHIFVVFAFCIAFLAILTTYTVKLEKSIKKESETDKLTGVANRNGLAKYLEKIGDQKKNYLLAIFDVDDFREFNEKHGHLCGDYVLKEIAKIAKENSSDDFVSRWGGEEFIIISKREEDNVKTYDKLDQIRYKIENYEFDYNNKKLKATITIGAAAYQPNISLDEWIRLADVELYTGKHSGKNMFIHK